MSAVHGIHSYVSFGGTDISVFLNDLTWGDEADTAETTTFTILDKTYVGGPRDHTVSASGLYDGDVDAVDDVLGGLEGTTGTLIYGPAGSTSGLKRRSATAILTKYETSGSTGDAVQISADFQISGAVTRDTF